MATDFLNALDRIPKLIEQYQTENAKLEKDLPTLRKIVSGTWKKEDELKELKSEVATLERKIQLTLTPPEHSTGENGEHQQGTKANLSATDDKESGKATVIIARPKPPTSGDTRGFKI